MADRPPLIVLGLGNPGPRYALTRHNAGFLVADALARNLGASFKEESRFLSEVASTRLETRRLLIAKPQTYMNLSGRALQKLVSFYNILPDQLLVVCDDADIPFTKLRLRGEGSCGGQNGLRSIEESLQTASYPRLRIGIGRSDEIPLDAYVLMRFSESELAEMELVQERAVEMIKTWATATNGESAGSSLQN